MLKLNDIQKPIANELAAFEHKFKASMQSSVPLLDRITHYIVKRKGKQMRPMFVFFSAGLCGSINESTFRGASLVELLHTASLVHDDVVDNANERRGFFSVNALWKNKVAVLVGDFLLSKGLLLSVDNNDFHLLKIVSEAVEQMSEGELLQIEKARKLDIEESVYFEVIRQKTASLIASCCACGAASTDVDEETVKKMHAFGEKVGIAFQIKDDLFDFGLDDVGKPLGNDIKEKKMTLPLIYALSQTDKSEKRRIINLVKNHNEDNKKVAEVIAFVRSSGGLDYATEKMFQYQQEAFEILNSFPEGIYRTGLEQLVRYTTERKK
ncbi:polyprenyl synthetase family protein [Sphingobacterium spiritivorum]|uniref:Polyprenyl synthetase n=3 Tax=Sphingobacterium spiritivorum TaxID=258 RepID=D7VH76_SPHSI|nr:polyprenyl synthetase family protein [Sphingobacterium spiritivorum]EFK59428.1 polyprenyl synthetase [Sphingobacterium spiritivorum ATCC 33861]QQT33891.1 polyprenyl synthetase family protein [Sphingobacterium spiritivorum]WQD34709.1 polyprenyl synthetase family protein [Sphingobacterium spiritivorum]SUI97790.1 Heptaprenyl diphosphate synthase component 2 [Sphingobacterium spiritivorum]SUJ08450.1 Heptaprenyl diphosphate synthase component 2 [Sphingobacterium spiritivorum]